MQRRVKVQVSKAKQRVCNDLYARLDSKEVETDLYRLVRQNDGDKTDEQQTRVIKDAYGNILKDAKSVKGRWRVEELMRS